MFLKEILKEDIEDLFQYFPVGKVTTMVIDDKIKYFHQSYGHSLTEITYGEYIIYHTVFYKFTHTDIINNINELNLEENSEERMAIFGIKSTITRGHFMGLIHICLKKNIITKVRPKLLLTSNVRYVPHKLKGIPYEYDFYKDKQLVLLKNGNPVMLDLIDDERIILKLIYEYTIETEYVELEEIVSMLREMIVAFGNAPIEEVRNMINFFILQLIKKNLVEVAL